MTYSAELERNGGLQAGGGTAESVRYPDSLEGTGEMMDEDEEEEERLGKRAGPLQVSVTIPSMGEEDESGGDSMEEVSSVM